MADMSLEAAKVATFTHQLASAIKDHIRKLIADARLTGS